MPLNWLRERICVACKEEYQPTGVKQRFCPRCGITNEKKKDKLYQQSEKRILYRKHYDRSEMGKSKYKRYRNTQKYKDYSRNRYYSLPENIRKARYYLHNAVRDKKINKSPYCQKCRRFDWGIKRSTIEAHHYKGYEPRYWLTVQWLCVPCHKYAEEVLLGK